MSGIGNAQEGNYMETPGQLTMTAKGDKSKELAEILSKTQSLEIHQKFDWVEALTQGCCERNNKYKIFDAGGAEILAAKEYSPGCTRCCCAPYHSTMVYIEKPDGERLVSIERQACACPTPHKCVGGWCTCMECCKDGIKVYDGEVKGEAGNLENPPPPIFTLKEAFCGGDKCLFPKLYIHSGEDEKPVGSIVGPHCFGGCSELCVTATWNMSTNTPDNPEGKPLAEIKHLTPSDCTQICQEICSDTDRFRITYTENAGQMDRTTALASSILVDYMFFEMDNGMISCRNNKLEITCCFLNCCGMQCPCKVVLQGKNGGGQE
jgi:hypothetical protein